MSFEADFICCSCRGLWSSLLGHLLNFRPFCSLHLGKHCPGFLSSFKVLFIFLFCYGCFVYKMFLFYGLLFHSFIYLSLHIFLVLFSLFNCFYNVVTVLIFPCSFFFFCLSASSILLSFVTIYCFGCALSNKKLQCGRVVMFLPF